MRIFNGYTVDKPVSFKDMEPDRCYTVYSDLSARYHGRHCVKLYYTNSKYDFVLLVDQPDYKYAHVIDSEFAMKNMSFMKSDKSFTIWV